MSGEGIQHIYYFIAGGTALAGLMYKSGSVTFRFVKKQVDSLREDREKLHVVFQEVTPNHGSSIKDKINKLEIAVNRNNELTEKIFFRQRWLMENQDSPIFETDKDGSFIWVNERFARLFLKSSSFFLGNGWKNVIHPEDREKVESHWNKSVKEEISYEEIFRVISLARIIEVKVTATKTYSGGYIGSISILSCSNKVRSSCPCDFNGICATDAAILSRNSHHLNAVEPSV